MRKRRPSSTSASKLWWCAPAKAVNAALRDELVRGEVAAEARALRWDEDPQGLTWEEALHPSKSARLQLYKLEFLTAAGYDRAEVEMLQPHELNTAIRMELSRQKDRGVSVKEICDLDQAPNFARLRDAIPTLVSHSSIWSLRRGRVLIGDEVLASQGLPLHPGIASWDLPLGSRLGSLSELEKKDLAGNTINLSVLMSILAFVGRIAVPRVATLQVSVGAGPAGPCEMQDDVVEDVCDRPRGLKSTRVSD